MRRERLGLLAVLAIAVTACSPSVARDPGAAGEGAAGLIDESAPVPAQPLDENLTLDRNSNPAIGGTDSEHGGAPATGRASSSGDAVVPSTGAPSTTISVSRPGIGAQAAGDGQETVEAGPSRSERTAGDEPETQEAVRASGRETGSERELAGDEPVFDAEPVAPLGAGAAGDDVVLGGWAAFDRSIRDQLLRNGNTAVSVAVSIGGDLVHQASFGTRVPGTFTPMSVEDKFRIASISKPLTAITLLQLVQDGVVGLDEPVGERIADHLGVTDASAGSARLTVRSMLGHTTGFGKYYGTFFGNGAESCHHAGAIGLTQGGGGGGYRYSNMNYCLAGLAIEALTGRNYEDVVYERLLTPLGLSGLRLPPTFDPGPGEAQHVSTPGRNYMETLGAAGSWIASPSDLVEIFDSLEPTTPGWKPLTDETRRAMLTPTHGLYGQRGYGLGMILYGGGRYGHTGTIENTHAMVQNRGDGVIWAITVAGPFPDDTPRLDSMINRAFEAAGLVSR